MISWNRSAALAPPLVVTAVLAGLAAGGLFERFEMLTYDGRMRALSALASRGVTLPGGKGPFPVCDQVVVVTVDERTEAALPERLPMSRRRLAHFIDSASEAGAKVIALDYYLPGRSFYDPGQDDALAEALGRSGRVILGKKVALDEASGLYRVQSSSHPMFAEKALDQGFLFARSEVDGIHRSVHVVSQAPDVMIGSLSLVTLMRFLEIPSRKLNRVHEGGRLARIDLDHPPLPGSPVPRQPVPIPITDDGKLLLDFGATGDRAPFRTVSFIDFDEAVREEPELVKDRIVLLGSTTLSSHDYSMVPTVWLAGGVSMPGVYFHALALREMMWGTGVSKLSSRAAAGLFVLVAVVGVVLFPRLSLTSGVLALGGLWMLLALTGVLALAGSSSLWVPVATPAILVLALFLTDIVMRYRREATVRRRFEVLLSTYNMPAFQGVEEEGGEGAALVGNQGPLAWRQRDLLEIREYLAPPGYRLEGLLGRGGMSVVFEGTQMRLERKVAVKYLAPQLFSDAPSRDRFLQEARLTARLTHPNVVAVHDTGERNGVPYIVLEYVPGQSVKDRVRLQGRLDLREALDIARQALCGLGAAHAEGIVHRDVKSENLMRTPEGVVKVADFGIAKAAAGGIHTSPEVVMGTPATMSPEHARGESVTPRSDLYSMGIVLYEMLAGELPFLAESPSAILMKQIREAPPHVLSRRPDLPPEVDELIRRAMAKDPADRFPGASAFLEALEQVVVEAPDDAERPGFEGAPARIVPTPTRVTTPTVVSGPAAALAPPSGDTAVSRREEP